MDEHVADFFARPAPGIIDSIIKHTVHCAYCRKTISDKVRCSLHVVVACAGLEARIVTRQAHGIVTAAVAWPKATIW